MTVTVKKGMARGSVVAPPSKSMAHRNLICGAFSPMSKISNVAMSKDIEATLECLRELGAQISVDGSTVEIGGLSFDNSPFNNVLFCNESGSTLRFMIPVCLLFDEEIVLTGSRRLFQRSLEVYSDICRQRGLLFEEAEDGVRVKGPLKNGMFEVRGDISSQFISGLLFALPHLEGDSIIKITGEFESASYVKLTLSALESFGIEIKRPDDKTFYIKGNQKFSSCNEAVEGDYSNAAFFEALNRVGGCVEIEGLKPDSAQGDRVFFDLFDRIQNKNFPIDVSDCPDLAPILFAVSAVCGSGEFVGTRRLKIKESDRAETMRLELAKFGAEVKVKDNSVSINCKELVSPEEALCGHNDHRIVMSLAVLCTLTGGAISGAEAVSKSFPDFFERLSSLGIEVENNEVE